MLFEEVAEIARLAKLHDDVERVLFDEGLAVADDEGVDQFAHDGGLVYCLDMGWDTFLRAF